MLIPSRVSAWLWFAVTLVVLPSVAALTLDRAASGPTVSDRRARSDVYYQAAEYIGYSRSIELTPAQKQLRNRALSAIPAPCCSKFTTATCCCSCNLAKSIWGLSNYLIVRRDANVPEIQNAVRTWIALANPKGFSGAACDTEGGCARRFSDDGCGGMDEKNLVAAATR